MIKNNKDLEQYEELCYSCAKALNLTFHDTKQEPEYTGICPRCHVNALLFSMRDFVPGAEGVSER